MERYGRSSGFREPWRSYHESFSWPPRSYTCSFCKREFRSAQALGGHMNVHRRDRARLRQSPPWDPPLCTPNPNPNPNPTPTPTGHVPNLNFSPPSSTSEAKLSPVAYNFPSLISPLDRVGPIAAVSSSSTMFSVGPFRPRCHNQLPNARAVKALFQTKEFEGIMEEDLVGRDGREKEVSGNMEEDLDLELRLGYT